MTAQSVNTDLRIAPSTTSVAVTRVSHAVLLPLGTQHVQIAGGHWAERQRVNRETTLLAGYQELERTGSLDNLRIAAGLAQGSYRGLVFVDSDVYKWLEAVSWELGRAPSTELQGLADEVIAIIAAAQREDGYVNSYYQLVAPDRRFTDPQMGHELYCAGHLIQAAVANARMTRSTRLLGVAVRFADLLSTLFGEGGRPYAEGHPEIEMALIELYRVTGEDRYLKLACRFIDERGRGLVGPVSFGSSYYQDHEPVRDASTVTGHAVRQLYLNAGVTDAYLETGNQALLAAQLRQWDDMVSRKLYITGGIGSRHRDEAFGDPYELPPDRAYTETCAAISSVLWTWRLLLATGESKHADLIERTLYNGFVSGLSLDGRRFNYTNPLQVRSERDTQSSQGTRSAAEREPWYACACCPPNIMRLISSLGHYLFTVDGDGVQVHQYVAARVDTDASGGPTVKLQIDTDMPWAGLVEVVVTDSGDDPWTLSLRCPAWSPRCLLQVNGSDVAATPDQHGYLRIRRTWKSGDRVALDLDMNPRLTVAHPRVDAVRGCAAIERGPLVYALEQVDLSREVALEDVYLSQDPQLRAEYRSELLGGVAVVRANAVLRPARNRPLYSRNDGAANADPRSGPHEEMEVMAIPYYAWGNRGANAMRVWIPHSELHS